MKEFTVIGIDIAKNVFQVHGADGLGKPVFTKRISRSNFAVFMSKLPKCIVGMEACGGAHHWARKLVSFGFEVRLMSPLQVKKYTDRHQKNDARDAAACAEAATRGTMKFVAVKSEVQQSIQSLHRMRSHYVRERTALMNMIRGWLYESGIVAAQGKPALMKMLAGLMDPECAQLTAGDKVILGRLRDNLNQVEQEVAYFTDELTRLAKEDDACVRLQTIDGVGPLTATAVVAKIGNGSEFQKGRDLSAYLGLVPRQHSSGEKQVLGSITKHGDRYLRQLLVHGGRSCVVAAYRINKATGELYKNDAHSCWVRNLADRVGINKASVAVANKNARMMVAILKNKSTYHPELAHGQLPELA